MPVFVTVSRDQIRAIGRAVNADFALRAAADGADFLALGGAEARGFALLADRTRHGVSLFFANNQAGYAAARQKTKTRETTALAKTRLIRKANLEGRKRNRPLNISNGFTGRRVYGKVIRLMIRAGVAIGRKGR